MAKSELRGRVDDTLASHDEVRRSTKAATDAPPHSIPINAYLASDALVVVAPMPAVSADDVRVELAPGRLRITAAVRSAGPREYLVHEWEYGGYDRELDLPDGYGRAVEAVLGNGQLTVRVLAGPPNEQVLSPTAMPSGLSSPSPS